ncbi:DUF1643 domain-containing protein [Lysinibacillus sp. UGB7]|uniref:DUF1643 domain-containing protein n=1 Tax=Lysinibacillus sp. UGB7 TaxID=3411039 RepID=UPI003B7B7B49
MPSIPLSLRYYRITYDDSIGNYRYLLSFESRNRNKGEEVVIVLMNPSKAGIYNGVEKVDPTVGKVLCWCERQNYHTVHILNLFPYRDPNPLQLTTLGFTTLIGNQARCNTRITDTCNNSSISKVIVAWGDCDGILPNLVQRRTNWLWGILDINKVYHVGDKTENGNPRHGRMWNRNPQLNKWK